MIRRSLLLAIDALHQDQTPWVKYSKPFGKRGLDLYHWCSVGWGRNDHRGYGWGVSNALRGFVKDGDLTQWWREGRSRNEMIDLFIEAAREL